MKKLLLFIFISASALGQSVEIAPNNSSGSSNAIIKKVGIGFEHTDGTIRIGTYVNSAYGAFIQTHSNHPLGFATNDGNRQFVINTNGRVGIGPDLPAYWLDVNGRARIKHYTSASPSVNETAGIWYNKSNNSVGVFAGMYNDEMYGLSGMGSDLLWKFGFDLVNTKMGIGTMTPKHPLTFPSTIGQKISFWGGTNAVTDNNYGIGVQSSAFQFHVPTTNDNIVFGTGRSGAFTENMRITGTGNIGIRRSNPQSTLEVARGEGINGTAAFFGTTHTSHFNYSTDENTYIRGGKANSNVIINDVFGLGNVGIGTDRPSSNTKLHVHTVNDFYGLLHTNEAGLKMGTYAGFHQGYFGTFNNYPLALTVNSYPALTISTDQRFQFGAAGTPTGYKMSVDGKIICTDITTLPTSSWPDYVFKSGYQLKPLHEVENFIQANGHLPNIPKAEDMETKGVSLGHMSKLQMEKIEELTLYMIEMNKTLTETNKRLKKVEEENKLLKQELIATKSQH
ncbi:hypothetical protein [Emticicia sp. C21]|uniref:hypothetical protein n=1 Tax=Emticicia sp. C21 TaxID=2302915 RepID=UPI000E355A79|nr:hypothetical protein [Emticicia sp. C21]RFS18550.1 hypothetical protein D0T08_04680 [Emticicia sp. C21]